MNKAQNHVNEFAEYPKAWMLLVLVIIPTLNRERRDHCFIYVAQLKNY